MDLIEDLETKINHVSNTWKTIKNDKMLVLMFEEILAIGNYLNGTSNRGGAFGFKIDTLEKVFDLKFNSNNKFNAVMYILEKYEEKNIQIIEFDYDFTDLQVASKVFSLFIFFKKNFF